MYSNLPKRVISNRWHNYPSARRISCLSYCLHWSRTDYNISKTTSTLNNDQTHLEKHYIANKYAHFRGETIQLLYRISQI